MPGPGRLALAVVAILLLSAMGPAKPRIIDGDTLELGDEKIRLMNMDAPEMGQDCLSRTGRAFNCGAEARAALEKIVGNGAVTCDADGRDDYGRILARCHAQGRDIAAELVRAGYGFAFTRYGDDYAADQIEAEKEGRGLWSGQFVYPWEFRAEKWAVADAAAPDTDCPIKGNINSRGDRIYHTPWSRDYSRTRIDTGRGERWFCDEAEALSAGWRAPRN
ncbi:thermonuclease family protein [Halovulum dunhuangense]|uniref:Thermonuclease family protein n=1 Tax=Halovulum dunhuangense TaxID=1505036 RepID=A0A849KQ81_9RHOB|nr:thermonuclease family protein [Halovulum dunhuangense]NNU79223.1 thermonuclease family protein [Halovulum dunhuangense]